MDGLGTVLGVEGDGEDVVVSESCNHRDDGGSRSLSSSSSSSSSI